MPDAQAAVTSEVPMRLTSAICLSTIVDVQWTCLTCRNPDWNLYFNIHLRHGARLSIAVAARDQAVLRRTRRINRNWCRLLPQDAIQEGCRHHNLYTGSARYAGVRPPADSAPAVCPSSSLGLLNMPFSCGCAHGRTCGIRAAHSAGQKPETYGCSKPLASGRRLSGGWNQ